MSGNTAVEPGDKLVGVNGMAISANALYEALQAPINTTTILPLVMDDDKTVWSGEVDKGYANEAVAKAAEEGTLRKLRGFVRIQIIDTSSAETALHFEPATEERKAKVVQENKVKAAKAKQEAAANVQAEKQEAAQRKLAEARAEKEQQAKAKAEQAHASNANRAAAAAAAASRAAEAKAAKAKADTGNNVAKEAVAAKLAKEKADRAKAVAAQVVKDKAAAVAAVKAGGGGAAMKVKARAAAAAAAVAAAKKKAAVAKAAAAKKKAAKGGTEGGEGGGGGGGGGGGEGGGGGDGDEATAAERAKALAQAAKKKAAETAKQKAEDAKKKARELAIANQKAKEEAKKKERAAAVAAEKELIKKAEAEKRKKVADEMAAIKAVQADNQRKRGAGEEYTFKVVFAEPGTMGMQFSTTARFAELSHIEPGSAATRLKENLLPGDALVEVNKRDTTGMDARQAMQAIGHAEWPRRLTFRRPETPAFKARVKRESEERKAQLPSPVLTIVKPHIMAGVYNVTWAGWGAHMQKDCVAFKLQLSVLDDNGDVSGCLAPESGSEVKTFDPNAPIHLAFRGSCTFTQKAFNAQAHGAGALIIINTKDGPAEDMPAGNADTSKVQIPVAMISKQDGSMLEAVVAATTVEGWFEMSGECSDEHDELSKLLGSSSVLQYHKDPMLYQPANNEEMEGSIILWVSGLLGDCDCSFVLL
jgi:hypothetical protein